MLTLKIAYRNMLAHKMKSLIIGFIIIFGTTLAIVGNSFVDAISKGMQKSLTDSVTGEIQIYSSTAKEQLSVLGNMDGSMPDVGHVNDFGKIRDTLLQKIPEIQAIVPMGSNYAMVTPGNILDTKLEELRALFSQPKRPTEKIASAKEHIQAIIQDLSRRIEENRASVKQVLDKDEFFEEAPANLKIALAPEFWSAFDQNAEQKIEFLANKLAPLLFDDAPLWLAYLGTVPRSFEEAFSQFEIVKGERIPPGKRGFLFSNYFYETFVKHRIARRFDLIKKRMDGLKVTIANDKQTQDLVTASVAQAAEIYTQIAPSDMVRLKPKLQALLKSKTTDFQALVREFLQLTDANFTERHDFFYREIGPYITLYKYKVGDVFPITAFARSGYASSVNMKIYGTYRFKSFESSPIAGNFNLMDMISFRELYGFVTADKREETQALEKEMGLTDINDQNIEDLFKQPIVKQAAQPKRITPAPALADSVAKTLGGFEQRRRIFDRQYTDREMEDGVFLNAAVVLKDPATIDRTLKRIQEVSEREKLGIQAIQWRDAAGMVGQLTIMVRGMLYLLVMILFGIATFVIMNSMLMAAMERTREIGTLRAIGAQKSFIRSLFLQETFVISFVFGTIGTLIGVALILTIGKAGIPSSGGDPNSGDVSSFFFSGDRLYLSVNPTHIFIVFVCMTLVAIISTQYPAIRAMRISPLDAMQKTD